MILAAAATAAAQTPVMNIVLKDGSTQTIKLENITEVTFGEITETPTAGQVAGTYKGVNTVVVGGMYSYTAEVEVNVTANADGTVNFTWPEYKLTGTVMGDLTLGTYTIPNLAWDADKGGFFADYSDAGINMHFKAVQGGTAIMDKDYTLGKTSTVLVKVTDKGITVENPFKLGAMPFPIVATFDGAKK